jgi:multiple sugar transport system permease protein
MTTNTVPATSVAAAVPLKHHSRFRWQRLILHVFLIGLALVWLFPIMWTLFTALRPYGDTIKDGVVSFPRHLNFDNFVTAWNVGDLPRYFFNTLIIAVPAVTLTLWISSMLGFIFARFSFRANLLLLMMFTAGNLLPPQVIIVPLYRMYLALPLPVPLSDHGVLYDSYVGIIFIHVIFQTGFCTFVLSNYMKTIPRELNEAALVDGASVPRMFFQVIMPLCRPALAALATLEFTWLYNDFFWAVVLLNQGAERPITSSIANLGGQYFSNDNLIAAASMIIALPTLAVYLAMQKQFISGLTLGANKG